MVQGTESLALTAGTRFRFFMRSCSPGCKAPARCTLRRACRFSRGRQGENEGRALGRRSDRPPYPVRAVPSDLYSTVSPPCPGIFRWRMHFDKPTANGRSRLKSGSPSSRTLAPGSASGRLRAPPGASKTSSRSVTPSSTGRPSPAKFRISISTSALGAQSSICSA